MEREQVALLAAPAEGVAPRIAPDVAAVAPELAELDVVAMRAAAALEDQHQLMLAAVERAHPGVVLDPDAEILELGIGRLPGRQQLGQMAPIHTYVMQGAVDAVRSEQLAGVRQEGGELRDVQLA